MTSQSKRAARFIWSIVAAAVVALIPSPASAGPGGHHARHSGGPQQYPTPHRKANFRQHQGAPVHASPTRSQRAVHAATDRSR